MMRDRYLKLFSEYIELLRSGNGALPHCYRKTSLISLSIYMESMDYYYRGNKRNGFSGNTYPHVRIMKMMITLP